MLFVNCVCVKMACGQSRFEEKTNTLIVNGSHETVKLSGLLEIFIKKYVQCYGCFIAIDIVVGLLNMCD